MYDLICPKCAGAEVAKSRAKNRVETWAIKLTGRRPLRCMECRKRFWRQLDPGSGAVTGAAKFAIFVVVLAVLSGVLAAYITSLPKTTKKESAGPAPEAAK